MNPVAAVMAVKAVRAQADSALPSAPVGDDAPGRNSPPRRWVTAYLRASAHRRSSLADRLDRTQAATRSLSAVGGCSGSRVCAS